VGKNKRNVGKGGFK